MGASTVGVLMLVLEVHMTQSAKNISFIWQMIRSLALFLLLIYFDIQEARVMFCITFLQEMALVYLIAIKLRYDVVLPIRLRDRALLEGR